MTRFRGGKTRGQEKRYVFLVWVEERRVGFWRGLPFLLYRPRPILPAYPVGVAKLPKLFLVAPGPKIIIIINDTYISYISYMHTCIHAYIQEANSTTY